MFNIFVYNDLLSKLNDLNCPYAQEFIISLLDFVLEMKAFVGVEREYYMTYFRELSSAR